MIFEIGTNPGPGGTGHRVQISGFEEWHLGTGRLIAESQGHFDAADYQRQLEHGTEDNAATNALVSAALLASTGALLK